MITAVVGAQFGSEGKGAVVERIARNYDYHVRVGAANAGHTAYVRGEKHVLQQIPVAAYANPNAILCIGPGAIISLDILAEELKLNKEWRKKNLHQPPRVMVDWRAHIVRSQHVDREQDTDLAERIGSTSTIAREGIGACQAARVNREASCATVADNRTWFEEHGCVVTDVPNVIYSNADNVLLEGTQGLGLSLTTGHFPYVTSRNASAAGLAADCGIGPRHLDHVINVMRTYPIRVHGNSGPFGPGSEETTFEEIGVSEERTTVTKLVRRVATFSMQQAIEACEINSATRIALTFSDYIAPSTYGVESAEALDYTDPGVHKLRLFIDELQRKTHVPVWLLGTSPQHVIEWLPDRELEIRDAVR